MGSACPRSSPDVKCLRTDEGWEHRWLGLGKQATASHCPPPVRLVDPESSHGFGAKGAQPWRTYTVNVAGAIKKVEADGWYQVRQRGVTIAGKPGQELVASHLSQHLEAGGTPVSRYLVVIERAGHNYSAYVPDLPGETA
jgi:predicted RNA binding protein YcfA (HicA-like mRNA interferase family)